MDGYATDAGEEEFKMRDSRNEYQVILVHGVGNPRPQEIEHTVRTNIAQLPSQRIILNVDELIWGDVIPPPMSTISTLRTLQAITLQAIHTLTSVVPRHQGPRPTPSAWTKFQRLLSAALLFQLASFPQLVILVLAYLIGLNSLAWCIAAIVGINILIYVRAAHTAVSFKTVAHDFSGLWKRTVLLPLIFPIYILITVLANVWLIVIGATILTLGAMPPLIALGLWEPEASMTSILGKSAIVLVGSLGGMLLLRGLLRNPTLIFADLTYYLGEPMVADQILEALEGRVSRQKKDAKIILVGHSLGSLIILDWLKRASPNLTSNIVGIVTMGSPLRGVQALYPERYHSAERLAEKFCAAPAAIKWCNIYRPTDYVGTRLFRWPKSTRYWDERIAIRILRHHMNYWDEKVLANALVGIATNDYQAGKAVWQRPETTETSWMKNHAVRALGRKWDTRPDDIDVYLWIGPGILSINLLVFPIVGLPRWGPAILLPILLWGIADFLVTSVGKLWMLTLGRLECPMGALLLSTIEALQGKSGHRVVLIDVVTKLSTDSTGMDIKKANHLVMLTRIYSESGFIIVFEEGRYVQVTEEGKKRYEDFLFLRAEGEKLYGWPREAYRIALNEFEAIEKR